MATTQTNGPIPGMQGRWSYWPMVLKESAAWQRRVAKQARACDAKIVRQQAQRPRGDVA